MDFTYSEEQQMLADSLRRFVESEYPFAQRRRRAREGASFDRTIWSQLAEMGVLGLTTPAQYGGFGEGAASRLVVQRELGRALVQEPVVPCSVMATAILAAHGSAAQQDRVLGAMATGAQIVVPAYAEAASRYRLDAVATRAAPVGRGYVLDGAKALVWHGEIADAFIVSARVGDPATGEIALFLVPRESRGVSVTGYPTMDGQRAADVKLDAVALGADALIGAPGEGVAALAHGVDHGIAALCAEAAGAMERLIEITAEYLRTRRQFGQPLAAFQALQHRMADMVVQKELALSMAYVAAQALDEPDARKRRRMLAAAKVTVAKAGRFVGQQAVQLHGGMGMTDELEVGDYFKRLTMFDPLLGDSDHHTASYAEAMED
ncbi:acyl-CoA dehydrogenase family protein [Paraburkholderia unamae]|uniref:Alkylation response protein AidB-like acyl-CoA dehydrogenase n=1 Tax=Paraburkholderia unamae TaxID=219649 RepID=A0ABX5K921_9BURK|nr:acyl-CoA dehydrogenase [Paraburkholderia unamae]PVX60034.1 alkylation response protein AidB-like acyl-CoA dehydrogenase [Paraburkholderia unamae]RAR53928.1 alkylation response protein AidB-like acyl-CoA dehydrogenase [Paraburkholderia unamae]CAG9274324.1 Acyl-CoA dehydrogenase [Paraburkholderia unamae]